jgi:hypothetical protein
MNKLLLTLAFILTPSCVSDPLDVSPSYLQADLTCYQLLAPVVGAMATDMQAQPLELRTVNPMTGSALTDTDLQATQLMLDTWAIRLQAAGVAAHE